jgi:2-polyprenyl-3-methyl-5-hydroxy-6-metoxy-1,4-benzoquinol methylase
LPLTVWLCQIMEVWDQYYHRKGTFSFLRGLSAPFDREVVGVVNRLATCPPEAKVLEIGGGEGGYLALICRSLSAIPYAIDISMVGAAACRETLGRLHLDANNIIHGDVFDPALQAQWKDQFDFVCSFGFVEHFENLHQTLLAHINLVRPGGFCFVTIPNFKNPYNKSFCRIAKGHQGFKSLSINEDISLSDVQDSMRSQKMNILECGCLRAWPFFRPVSIHRTLALAPMLLLALAGNMLKIPIPHVLGATMYAMGQKIS